MPNTFLQYCFYISREPFKAIQAFWEMPLAILWQLIHCELSRNGVEVRYSLGVEDAIGLIRDTQNV